MHHHPQTPVAAGRSTTERRRSRLAPLIAFVSRKVMFAAPRLAAADRRFLSDAARAEARYPMAAVDRMIDCSAQAETAAAREAFPEAIRGEILRRSGEQFDVVTAFEAEELSNGPANVAQWRYLRDRSETNRQAVIEALMEQQAKTRSSIDALLATGRVAL